MIAFSQRNPGRTYVYLRVCQRRTLGAAGFDSTVRFIDFEDRALGSPHDYCADD